MRRAGHRGRRHRASGGRGRASGAGVGIIGIWDWGPGHLGGHHLGTGPGVGSTPAQSLIHHYINHNLLLLLSGIAIAALACRQLPIWRRGDHYITAARRHHHYWQINKFARFIIGYHATLHHSQYDIVHYRPTICSLIAHAAPAICVSGIINHA